MSSHMMEEETEVKLDKLKELKDLIYDLLSDGYSDSAIMEEVKDSISEKPEGSSNPVEAMEEKGDNEDALQKMKRDYFKPKPPASRNGTGVFIAAMQAKQAPKPMNDGKSMAKAGKMK